jgi:hypothetical protein
LERTVFGMRWKGGDSIGVGERMEEVQPCPNVVSDCEQVKRLANQESKRQYHTVDLAQRRANRHQSFGLRLNVAFVEANWRCWGGKIKMKRKASLKAQCDRWEKNHIAQSKMQH